MTRLDLKALQGIAVKYKIGQLDQRRAKESLLDLGIPKGKVFEIVQYWDEMVDLTGVISPLKIPEDVNQENQ